MRRFLVALSFANLCYLRIWSELLTYRRSDTYLMVSPPPPVEYFALMANVLLMAIALWALSLVVERVLHGRNSKWVEMAIVLALVMPLNSIRAVASTGLPYLKSPLLSLLGTRGTMALGVFLAIAGLTAVIFFHRKVALGAVAVLATVSPFCAVTFGQALWRTARYDAREYLSKPVIPAGASARKSPRVIWFIADEWDYRLTFVDRNPTLALPELDRLRQGSIYAENALPPGQETPISIPSYYDGTPIDHVIWDGPRTLRLHPVNSAEFVDWAAQTNVFQRAGALGVNTALVEWFHPACRILNGLNHCSWRPMAMQHNSMGESFGPILFNQTRSLFETTLLSLFGRSLAVEQQTRVYHAILAEGIALANDCNFAFTVVHLPVPHAPHSYDRKTGTFTLGNAPISGYVDSLALLDRTVGEIRRAMEAAGTWNSTTVLFTTDHPYREAEQLDGKSDPRIPYILKLAGQTEGVDYKDQFNTILTGDLLLSVLGGEITDTTSAKTWLDRKRDASLAR